MIVKLKDVCTKIGSGATPKGGKNAYKERGISLIRSQNVLDYEFSHEGLAYIDEVQAARLNSVTIKPDDVLLNITGDSVARVCIVDNSILPARINQHVCIVRADKDKILSSYILYFLQMKKFELLALASSGATRNALTKGMIENLEVDLPSLNEQKKIVSLLDFIDNKIRCNVRINKNLEQQAVVLFRSWFTTFCLSSNKPRVNSEFGEIPEDFAVVKVGSLPMLVIDYVANGSFASLKANVNLYQEPNYAYFIRNTDLKSGSFSVFVDKHSYEFLSKSTLYGGEIIISNVGDVGSVFLCPKLDGRMTLGNNIIMLRPEDDHLRYYLYIWFKYLQGQALIQGIKGGSAQPKFNKTDFKNTSVLIPPKDILTRFHETVAPMFDMISQRQTESAHLADLRDTLLPKLMSGEIDVSDLNL
ncbi:restriction endonuclease subunit S [Veillonellaceae bacterium WCA-693-APC-5D-A]|uniref:Restriction endonuclease subunit S n=1 Tax=Anaerovibrio slackiae TaxID=2652309 RepID=A0A6I2UK60_9FIRM|nr:restriction endonuclease subunit S [Anaerovibrio slackiae]MSU10039.1 restriction endonuclease subunit S [Anaerovibrio slackiae]